MHNNINKHKHWLTGFFLGLVMGYGSLVTAVDSTVTDGIAAGEIIGMAIVNPQEEQLGAVENLAIDWESGRVTYAIVSYGGYLTGVMDIEDKLFAVPAKALQWAEDHLILDLSREQLQQVTGFDQYDWPDMKDSQWQRETHRQYALETQWEQLKPDEPLESQVETATADYMQHQATGSLQKASDLEGMEVLDTKGETVGRVQHLLIDWDAGRVVNAVVAFSDLSGPGKERIDLPQEQIEVPLDSMTLEPKEAGVALRFSKDNYLRLNVPRESLK